MRQLQGRLRYGAVTLTVISGVCIAQATEAAAPASADPVKVPRAVALTGTLTGSALLDANDVFAYALPEKRIEAAAAAGSSATYFRLPDADVEVSGTSYALVVDPADLPSWTISSSGLVTFQVLIQDEKSSTFGQTSASVRAVYDDLGNPSWVSPLTPTDPYSPAGSRSRATSRSTPPAHARSLGTAAEKSAAEGTITADVAPTIAGNLCDANGCADPEAPARVPDVNLDVDRPKTTSVAGDREPSFMASRRRSLLTVAGRSASGASKVSATDDEVEGSSPLDNANGSGTDSPDRGGELRTGGCGGGDNIVYGRTSDRSATIGTAYPIAGDTAWMSHAGGSSDQYSATFGVAMNSGGFWNQSSTESIDRSFGFDWDPRSYHRSFRVGVVYRKLLYYYDRPCDMPPYYSTWVPVQYSGAVGENRDVTRPEWYLCKPIASTGKWWRQLSTGTSYSLSYGVKWEGVLGIDLSSKRAYNKEARLGYHITKDRFMCGDNDFPATAGKVMERINQFPPT